MDLRKPGCADQDGDASDFCRAQIGLKRSRRGEIDQHIALGSLRSRIAAFVDPDLKRVTRLFNRYGERLTHAAFEADHAEP